LLKRQQKITHYRIGTRGHLAHIVVRRNPDLDVAGGSPRMNARGSSFGRRYALRYAGGPLEQNQMYNINEFAPEDVYSGGAVTRNPNPMTIDGRTGYVEGRAYGGYMNEGGVLGGAYKPTPPWGGPAVMQGAQLGGQGIAYDPSAGNYSNNVPGSLGGPPLGPTVDNMPPIDWDNVIVDGPVPKDPNVNLPSQKPTPPWGGSPPKNVPRGSYPRENPGGVEGGYQFQTEPGYQFRFEEGQRALDRGAAARGGLLSGGYGRKAIRYGQGFASNEYANVYNRIANIAGLGQTGATTSGNAALYAGSRMGTAASNAANATAYGQIGAGNAWANAGNQLAQMPWDQFNWSWGGGGGGGGGSGWSGRPGG
jgi:hypothetical protein